MSTEKAKPAAVTHRDSGAQKFEGGDLNGLQYMQAVVAKQISMPPMAETIPMQCVAAGTNTVTFSARADARHLNRAGNVHGGFTATVMDSVTSCALRTALEARVGFVTIELNVKLLKPVPAHVDLRGEGKMISVSRRLGVAEAQLFDNRDNLCAHCTATFMLLRPEVGKTRAPNSGGGD
jgi:uncharacterized protein (TIGR00369 family)